jgi:hypothetical protein
VAGVGLRLGHTWVVRSLARLWGELIGERLAGALGISRRASGAAAGPPFAVVAELGASATGKNPPYPLVTAFSRLGTGCK